MSFRLVQTLPAGATFGFSPIVYNTPNFLKSNNDLPQIHYHWIDFEQNKVMGHVAFSLEEGEAVSPIKAPFGGIEYSDNLKYEELCTFVIFIEKELKASGIRFVRLHQPPRNYQDQGLLNQVLEDLKYRPRRERVYHGISVSSDSLLEQMASMEQRRLRKCSNEGMSFKVLKSNDLPEVYRALRKWRDASNKPLSMSWEALNSSRKSSPNAYVPFGVFDQNKLVAATIAIRVSDTVLYHFYPAHDPKYNNFSPMVFLIDGMYTWCQGQGFELLDLGTSYVNDKMNRSLVRFKVRVGGVESRAKIYRKTLSSR